MDPMPPELAHRLATLQGGAAALVFEHTASAVPIATLVFWPGGAPELRVVIEGVREASWGFLHTPQLRVPWRFTAPVRAVRLSTARAFGEHGSEDRIRVDVDFDGAASLAFEGTAAHIGPVMPAPPSRPNEGFPAATAGRFLNDLPS